MRGSTRLRNAYQGKVCLRGLYGVLALAVLLSACPSDARQATAPSSTKKSARELPTLTTAHQAHSLNTAEAARAYPVHLRAVVTYFNPNGGNGFASLFVNDGTGGVWVNLPTGTIASLPAGTLVEVTGVSSNGLFAPVIASPHLRVLGRSHLPDKAVRVNRSSLLGGLCDSEWVEVEGTIHSISEVGRIVMLHLQMPDGGIDVVMTREAGVDYARLVDAQVLIRGNAAPVFSRVKFQMVGARLMTPGLSSIKILEPAPSDPFNEPATPVDSLMRWDHISILRHRVHLRGTVTLFWPGSSLCLQDASGTICTRTRERTPLAVGELADIVGFAGVEGDAHVLTDVVYRPVGQGGSATPTPMTAADVVHGLHESELIVIEGRLIGHDTASPDTTLVLSTGDVLFTAVLPESLRGSGETGWQNGSKLRITGICSVRVNAQSSAVGEGIAEGEGSAVTKSFRVLLRSPGDVVVLHNASWWTTAHMLVVLALALVVTLLVLVWVWVLRRRVEEQTKVIRESEERFRQMALHDALTGLATRPLLQDRLHVALDVVQRHQTGLALLVLDVDKFKQVNDTFGHPAGDEVLRVVAARLLESVRKSDTVARIGGDEFVVLLTELNDSRGAEKIAASIVEKLGVPIPFADREVPVSVSVGLCTDFAAELDADTLMKNADAALYYAKTHGRNRFQVFTPDQALT
jgi:diguanylate cyclase (GGDEF)-like protein